MRRALALTVVLAGCTFGEDTPTDPPRTCGPIPDVLCVDTCCSLIEAPFFDGCRPFCPSDLRLISGACDPLPICDFDGGGPPDGDVCAPDALLVVCQGGPCCEEEIPAELNAACEYECPAGFSQSCDPSPSCEINTPCEQPSECVLTANTCCGTCETPTLEDVIGVHSSDVSDFQDSLCAEAGDCPPCVVSDPNPSLVATCNATTCRAVDLERLPASACDLDEECVLRTTSCCECDSTPTATNVVSLRGDRVADLLALVCDDGVACDACVPDYPAELSAFCNDEGRCDVRVE
ncbi:MAG: hypothetical protein AAGE52_18445 [Myxococcota bacterium]